MPPRLFFAQNVTVRPRSAAASTVATFPSSATSGSPLISCNTTNGSSPSTTNRFDPPPRNLCATPCSSSNSSSSGIASCLLIRSRSVVPPMPSDVNSASETRAWSSTPNSGSAAWILAFSIRMPLLVLHPEFRPQKHHQLAARLAHVSSANGHQRVSGLRFAQQKFDRILHRAEVVHVLVPCLAKAFGQGLAGHVCDRRLTGGINVQQCQHVRLVERARKFVPQMLRPRIAVRLKQRQQAVELATSRRLQRCSDLRRVMPIVVHHRDIVHHTFDVETAPYTRKLRQPFANQVARN